MPAVTDAGLQVDTLGDVREGLNADWREAFGASMDVSDRSPDGQLLGIAAEPYALLNELLEVLAGSIDPNKASGALLRALCALTGTVAPVPTFSTVVLTLIGTPTTPVPAGSLVSTESTGQQFTTIDDVTIAAIDAWEASTPYLVDAVVTNAGNLYECITAGTSAGSGGPSGTTEDEIDNDVHWRFIASGTGIITVPARATTTGPIVAVAGDLIHIDTPVGGWDQVFNELDATLGSAELTDAQLRVRRVLELGRPGTSPANAIRAALLDVDKDTQDPVTSATVFVNNSEVTDADGIPPHSIEPMVKGGSDQAIWDALLANVAAGIRTHGTEIGTATDSKGVVHTMKFSRVDEIDVWIDVTLVKDPATYPADGDNQVKLAIVTAGNARPDGTDVVSSKLISAIDSVSGVLEIDLPLIDDAPTPTTTTTIPVSLRQRAVFDTSRITVSSSDGTP